MTISSAKTGEPDSDYALLHLATEAGTGGPPVEHFVCYECHELVEIEAGSKDIHRCSANTDTDERRKIL